MEKSEFSETQYVFGYIRELFSQTLTSPEHFLIYAPSTREEKKLASDIILDFYHDKSFRYSECYQFKRSKYYNNESFTEFNTRREILTLNNPKYGFNIYNSAKTKQFNTLQSLALEPNKRVYYCAPIFHTIEQFNNFFRTQSIHYHSKVINFSQPILQNAIIPTNSNHHMIFDRNTSYLCSEPKQIESYIASERNRQYIELDKETYKKIDFEKEIEYLYKWVVDKIYQYKLNENFEPPIVNFFEVREMLLLYFNIHWFPYFSN